MPYKIKGNCIYKKDDNSKVGCTKGDVNKYMAALHANVDENALIGGISDTLTVQDIADKFGVGIGEIQNQINKGIGVEMEHTNDKIKATEIATDHVAEIPDYYNRLEKMEREAFKELGNTTSINTVSSTSSVSPMFENSKSVIKRLLRENLFF